MRVDPNRNAEGPGETEVSKLDSSFAVNEQVLRLEVSVYDAALVAEQHCLHYLVKVALRTEINCSTFMQNFLGLISLLEY